MENAAGTQYTPLESASLGSSQPFQPGGSADVYYDEFANGTGTLDWTNTAGLKSTCGSFSVPGGYYSAVRCKYSPLISGVQSNLSTGLPGLTVASGSTITISGVGFSSASGTTLLANGAVLTGQIVSDQEITASLPSTYSGLVVLAVSNTNGADAINIFVAPPAQPPTISLSSTHLQFSYTAGGAAPASQNVIVSNSGGGTLTWSVASNVSWLTLASGEWLTVSANPSGLSPNTYTGTITITAAGASNSPQIISVTLVVTAPPPAAPSITLSASQLKFTYTAGAAAPPAQSISISNSGGGALAWSASSNFSWLAVTPSGTAPSTLAISVSPASLTPGPYQGVISVTATGAANNPQTVTVSLNVSAAAAPSVAVASVTNSASGASGAIAPGEIITIKGNGLGPATGVSFSVDPSTGMVVTTLSGTSVLFGSFAAPITYTSTGQINAIVPYEIAGQSTVVMQVQYQGATSAGTTLQVASAAPGAFTFSGTGSGQAVAANQDGSLNGASNAAALGSYVTIYFTGGGGTNPPGVTGSVTGAVLKWLTQAVSVTVGNVPATERLTVRLPRSLMGWASSTFSWRTIPRPARSRS